MITLRDNMLGFEWPEVHEEARCSVSFQRTLRIPDDGQEYPLPAGLGSFPLRHVDDHAAGVPATWLTRGGVILPMHQAEAMWISFSAEGYPVAMKIAAGKINAVSGSMWTTALDGPASDPESLDPEGGPRREGRRGRGRRGPAKDQDYVVVPEQPWLDGFNVAEGRIRQFVAMPLGGGHTAEEQVTGRAEVGGIQLLAYPMKAQWYARLEKREAGLALMAPMSDVEYAPLAPPPEMGLGLGGLMHQDIEADPFGTDAWDLEHPARCFVHLANAEQWTAITGEPMPTRPVTREEYALRGIPWFDYAAQGTKVAGSETLAGLSTVGEIEADAGGALPDEGSIPIDRVRRLPAPPAWGEYVREDSTW